MSGIRQVTQGGRPGGNGDGECRGGRMMGREDAGGRRARRRWRGRATTTRTRANAIEGEVEVADANAGGRRRRTRRRTTTTRKGVRGCARRGPGGGGGGESCGGAIAAGALPAHCDLAIFAPAPGQGHDEALRAAARQVGERRQIHRGLGRLHAGVRQDPGGLPPALRGQGAGSHRGGPGGGGGSMGRARRRQRMGRGVTMEEGAAKGEERRGGEPGERGLRISLWICTCMCIYTCV